LGKRSKIKLKYEEYEKTVAEKKILNKSKLNEIAIIMLLLSKVYFELQVTRGTPHLEMLIGRRYQMSFSIKNIQIFKLRPCFFVPAHYRKSLSM
jgi:hypothetical protein